MVLATTTAREMLDPTILRPGRLDIHIELGLPTLEARVNIVKHHLAKMPLEVPGKAVDELAVHLAQQTDAYSGAQLENFCRESAFQALRRDIHAETVKVDDVTRAMHDINLL